MALKYYPYFRGRQFELIALRELVEKNLLSPAVVPIVEPIKLSSTLLSTFQVFAQSGHRIGLVRNPEFGDVVKELKEAPVEKRKEYSRVFQKDNVYQVLIQNNMIDSVAMVFRDRIVSAPEQWIAIYGSVDALQKSIALSQQGITYGVNLIPDTARFRRSIKGYKALFRDCFEKRDRNADYSKSEDEFFTDDHTYAEEESYVGTGDYSIIGSEYSDSGFAPYAVAIHVVYEDPKNANALRIRHFVSTSNDGIEDPAGKFREAAKKLEIWVRSAKPEMTYGLSSILTAYENRNYPGLGSLKKFSIMHHLELMSKIIER